MSDMGFRTIEKLCEELNEKRVSALAGGGEKAIAHSLADVDHVAAPQVTAVAHGTNAAPRLAGQY